MENKTKEALVWIVEILKRKHIPFQITAGMAAKIYGSNRELYDIDIDVPEDRIDEIAEEAKDYITEGPYQHKSENFDLILLTLDYHGQPIDIGGAYDVKIKNKDTGKWEIYPTDFSKSQIHEIFGIQIPVVTKEELISYKSKVARLTDLEDVRQIQ